MTFVAGHYRADMGEKIYAGHSYGGLIGVHVLLTEPDMFQRYVLGSPSSRAGCKPRSPRHHEAAGRAARGSHDSSRA
jgi:pimeloyl-ACP methyl ester carboxylesterase